MPMKLRNGEYAEDVRERVDTDYDIPAGVLVKEVTRDTTLETAIRVYPSDDDVDYDVPNQICWDLKRTWRWRAVALHDPDGAAVEWYACKENHVRNYWPEYFEDPVWKRDSIYAFIKSWDEADEYTYALHHWPIDMDPDAEVVG